MKLGGGGVCRQLLSISRRRCVVCFAEQTLLSTALTPLFSFDTHDTRPSATNDDKSRLVVGRREQNIDEKINCGACSVSRRTIGDGTSGSASLSVVYKTSGSSDSVTSGAASASLQAPMSYLNDGLSPAVRALLP